MLEIDGSYGEGGGQVLRTSLSLSCLLGLPFRIFNIRANRPKPGLQPQHLTAVLAAQQVAGARVEGATQARSLHHKGEVTGARVEGAQLKSTGLSFAPGSVAGGNFEFDVSRVAPSAGSCSLILQTILPPLAFARSPSTLTLRGGTHVPFSPVFEYLHHVFLPSLAKLGLSASLEMRRAGYYPVGGGEIKAEIQPANCLFAPGEVKLGQLKRIVCISAVSRLPISIAERQMGAMTDSLKDLGEIGRQTVQEIPSPGTGTYAFVLAHFEGSLAGFSSLGKRGKRAEQVGQEAADALKAFLASGAVWDLHLADQLLLWLALCKGHFRASVEQVTQHLLTNLWVVKQFLPVKVEVTGNLGKPGLIVGEGVGFELPAS